MKDSQKKRITRNYHLLRRVESWKCCRVTAFICPNSSGIQTNTWNISLKKNNLSITRNREVEKSYVIPINDDEFSLSWSASTVLWMWAACISLHTFQRTLRVSACRGQRTWRKVTKLESNAMLVMLGGTLVGTQYRNTVRKIGKYRNTVSKIDEIPIPHLFSVMLT